MVQPIERTTLVQADILPRVIRRYSPVVVDRGEDVYVWDIDGDRWTDFRSGIAGRNTGHCHPQVVRAI